MDDSKLEKKRRKDEKAAAAAYEAHREQSRAAADGPAPVITRNAGGGGSRDVHLERISVSNGGEELVTDASLTLAAGRRYGLIGCARMLISSPSLSLVLTPPSQ